MNDELLERTQTGGSILDRAGGLTTYTDRGPCRMVCCEYDTDGEHAYCPTCRSIYPDLSLLLQLSINKIKEERNG